MRNEWKAIILPITRWELPGWGRVLEAIGRTGYQHDHRWVGAPVKVIRGKEHGYLMELDLTDWSCRSTFFLGRYYELHVLRLLDEMLEPGDRFVDIGANVGMVALHASHRVGSSGSVQCFEPNPRCRERLGRMIEMNAIENIRVYPFGLSDQADTLELKQNHSYTGIGTFADVDPESVVSTTIAEVRRGDDVFKDDDGPAPKLMKIDVEGFELRAVRGMEQTLRRWGCPVIMEMDEHHLQRAHTSVAEVYALMSSMGYVPFRIGTRRRGLRHALELTLISGAEGLADKQCHDVLWKRSPDA